MRPKTNSIRTVGRKRRRPIARPNTAGVTATQFRQMALKLGGASESAHMDHPDFRVAGKIFATLGYPDDDRGMVKLPPDLQKQFVQKSPDAFTPCNGAWGRAGCTSVHLAALTVKQAQIALTAAWRNVVAQSKHKAT